MTKHAPYYISLLILLILLPSGCRKQAEDTRRPLAEWLDSDTEAAMRFINKSCTTLYARKQTDSVLQLYGEAFRHYPHKPTGNTDSLVGQIGLALSYFNTASFYQRKDQAFSALLDSLHQSGHPFLTGPALGYLLAYQAFATLRFDPEKAIEPAEAFAALPPQRNLSQELMSCHLVAWVLWSRGAGEEQYIPMQLRAVEAFRKGAQGNVTLILSQMSLFYRLTGQYDKAIDYSLQALDWEETNNGGRNNAGKIRMYGDLSDIYSQLLLYDKASETLDKAIESSRAHNNLYLCDLYRKKTSLFETLGQIDSTLYYIDLTAREAKAINDSNYIRVSDRERAGFFVREYKRYPDSLQRMATLLEHYNADSMPLDARTRTETRLWYGKALTLTGQVTRGKQLMEQAAAEMQYEEGMSDACQELANLYVQHKMGNELLALYPTCIALRDSIEKEVKVNAAIGADVRYETGRKEQENRALAAEVELKGQSLVYTRIILTLSLLLLVAAAGLLLQYRRMRRQEREKHLNEIGRLLSTQQELNRHNEVLNGKLEEIAHNETIDNVRQQLNPTLLSGEDEIRFRQSFAALYPRYLPKLRSRCPEITKSDELLCMLIYLKQNTDEVALALGISRASVNSARSRIRKKLGLQKDESLEEAVRF